jgi:hypothetical protein
MDSDIVEVCWIENCKRLSVHPIKGVTEGAYEIFDAREKEKAHLVL